MLGTSRASTSRLSQTVILITRQSQGAPELAFHGIVRGMDGGELGLDAQIRRVEGLAVHEPWRGSEQRAVGRGRLHGLAPAHDLYGPDALAGSCRSQVVGAVGSGTCRGRPGSPAQPGAGATGRGRPPRRGGRGRGRAWRAGWHRPWSVRPRSSTASSSSLGMPPISDTLKVPEKRHPPLGEGAKGPEMRGGKYRRGPTD